MIVRHTLVDYQLTFIMACTLSVPPILVITQLYTWEPMATHHKGPADTNKPCKDEYKAGTDTE